MSNVNNLADFDESQVSVVSGARRDVNAVPLASLLSRFSSNASIALQYNDEACVERVSYADLWTRTNALARALAALVRPKRNRDGDLVVAVCMKPTHNTVMVLLACWKAGAAYVPMEPNFPQQRIDHILQDAEPALVIYDDCCNPSMFVECGVHSLSFEALLLQASKFSVDALSAAETMTVSGASSIAIVLYTSGSTGVPKGVRIPYSAICNRLWWQFHTFPFTDTEAVCVWKTPLTFVDSVCEIWAPLVQGRTLLIVSRETIKNPQTLVQVLAHNHVQRLVLVPTLLRSILMYLSLNDSDRPLKCLKLWVSSGETLSKELATQFFKYFGDRSGYKLANFYGSTEVMGDVTYYVLENIAQLDLYDTIPIGSPLDNCAVYLLDEEMHPVHELEVGEIWVAGVNLARGYVRTAAAYRFRGNPHSTCSIFDRLYRTGDFGILQKGVILYAGRTDSQIKIRGHRVDLQEVERAVIAVDGVETAVVLCEGFLMAEPEILAFVTQKPTTVISASDAETALRSTLVSYMLPQVIIVESIPLLDNGKVDRQALLKIYLNENKSYHIDYSGIDTKHCEKARVLFETVGEVLRPSARRSLSVNAGFYELGGNSLNTIVTISKLREKGYYIEIVDFLEAANLGEVLSKLSTKGDWHGHRNQTKFTFEPVRDQHKQDVVNILVNSFFKKADLKVFCGYKIELSEMENTTIALWPEWLREQLSIVLRDASGTIVGVAINFDAHKEVETEEPPSGAFAKLLAFIRSVEDSVRGMIPQGKGKVLQNSLMATAEHLSAADNVAAICALEYEVMRIARERGFQGIITTNSSPLTQQLARDVLGYHTLLNYQFNRYVDSNGERLFADAPDDATLLVCWKPVK